MAGYLNLGIKSKSKNRETRVEVAQCLDLFGVGDVAKCAADQSGSGCGGSSTQSECAG